MKSSLFNNWANVLAAGILITSMTVNSEGLLAYNNFCLMQFDFYFTYAYN